MEHKGNKIKGGEGEITNRMMAWCAYQERSQHEARKKLAALGVGGAQAEEVIAGLVSSNFLNEERFALAFAGGKFRMKQWGRARIKAALKAHRISEPCVNRALQSITPDDYQNAVRRLAEKKVMTAGTADRKKKYKTTYTYLVGRGFESELVINTLNQLMGEVNNYEFRT